MAEQTIITTRLDGRESQEPADVVNAETVELAPAPEETVIDPDTTPAAEVIETTAEKITPSQSYTGSEAQADVPVVHEETSHAGPHIVTIKSDYIVDGLPITATVFTSILFLIGVFLFGLKAKSLVNKTGGKLRTAIVSFIDIFFGFMVDAFDGDRRYAKMYFPLIAGFFVIILF